MQNLKACLSPHCVQLPSRPLGFTFDESASVARNGCEDEVALYRRYPLPLVKVPVVVRVTMNQPSALADKAMLLGKEASEHLKIPSSLCLEAEHDCRLKTHLEPTQSNSSDCADCRTSRNLQPLQQLLWQ
jgi:hypothetical protein